MGSALDTTLGPYVFGADYFSNNAHSSFHCVSEREDWIFLFFFLFFAYSFHSCWQSHSLKSKTKRDGGSATVQSWLFMIVGVQQYYSPLVIIVVYKRKNMPKKKKSKATASNNDVMMISSNNDDIIRN